MSFTPSATQAQKRAWTGAVLRNGVEFPLTPLPILSGKLPTTLRGSLYRNGPGNFSRAKQRVGHWFDGDGAILAVHFQGDNQATGVYRYVQTQGYQEELAEEKLLYGGYGTLPSGFLPQKIGRHVKNVANTSVLAFSDEILALWEVGLPYALDPYTLKTKGMVTLGLHGKFPYSAHPKRDEQTGEIFNFGLSYWVTHANVNLYRSDATGRILQRRKYKMPHIGYIHDIALASRYLAIAIPPIRVHTTPHLALLQKPVSECMTWDTEKGTEIWVFDRATLRRVSRIQMEPWFNWHFGNGYEAEDGSLVLSIIRYQDFQINRSLQELVNGQIKTPSPSSFWQLSLDLNRSRVIDFYPLWQRSCEMPVVRPQEVGYKNRHTYMICHRHEYVLGEWFRAIASYNHQTHQVTEVDFGASCYPSEPIYAKDLENPEKGWILTVVYDGKTDQSEVWIFDADRLDKKPVCRLGLPEVIPLSFHGTWHPAI